MDVLYQNHPLDDANGDIRLLRFQHCSPSHDPATIEFSFNVSPIDDAPPYSALSYVWGAPIFCEQVKIDGMPVSITTNLLQALRNYAENFQAIMDDSLSSASSTSYLWVDALCINQRDVKEKTKQVQKMGQIYANSSLVWAWLGPLNVASELVIEECNLRRRRLCSLVFAMVQYGFELRDRNVHAKFAGLAKDGVGCEYRLVMDLAIDGHPRYLQRLAVELGWLESSTDAAALLRAAWLDFCSGEFWTRIWILQEMVLGQTVYLVSGTATTKLEHLLTIWSVMTSISFNSQETGCLTLEAVMYSQELIVKGDMISAILSIKAWKQLKGLRFTDLLFFTRSMKATEPKDRIYGILGISSDVETLGLSVDYSLSFGEICTEFAKQFIIGYGVVALTYAAYHVPTTPIPSWVTFYPYLEWPESFNGNLKDARRSTWDFTLSSSGEISQLFDEECFISPLILKIKGFSVDTVSMAVFAGAIPSEVTTSLPTRPRTNPDILQMVDLLALDATKRRIQAVRNRHSVPIWWLPILHGDPKAAPPSRKEAYQTKTDELYNSYLALRACYDQNKGSQATVIAPEAELYQQLMDYRTANQTFFNTGDHGFLGVGPASLKLGDKIVIFCGAETPFAIRPTGNGEQFLLLGEVYVLGLMHGEFLAGNPAIEEFLLE